MKKHVEEVVPSGKPFGGQMDRTNLDDPSRYYGLPHSSHLTPDERRQIEQREREEREERISTKDAAELQAYIVEHNIKGQAERLIVYLKAQGNQKSTAESLAVSRFLSMGGADVYRRIWKYIDADMELDAAVLMAQSEVSKEADIEASAESQGNRPARDAYLGDSVTNLMDAHRKTTGGGSRSSRKGRKTRSAKVEQDAHYQELIAQADTRPALVSGRVTERVHAFLHAKDAPASAGEIVEMVVGVMIDSGCGLATIQQWLACGIEELSKGDAA